MREENENELVDKFNRLFKDFIQWVSEGEERAQREDLQSTCFIYWAEWTSLCR